MTVKKMAVKPIPNNSEIEKVISRGGEVSQDQKNENGEVRITLRIPSNLVEVMDRERKERIGNVSRNQWILEVIAEYQSK